MAMGVVEHPYILILIAVLCTPLLFPLARFFFEDMETFLSDAGLDYAHNRWLWILGFPRLHWQLQFKIIGFVGVYGIIVFMLYITAIRVLF